MRDNHGAQRERWHCSHRSIDGSNGARRAVSLRVRSSACQVGKAKQELLDLLAAHVGVAARVVLNRLAGAHSGSNVAGTRMRVVPDASWTAPNDVDPADAQNCTVPGLWLELHPLQQYSNARRALNKRTCTEDVESALLLKYKAATLTKYKPDSSYLFLDLLVELCYRSGGSPHCVRRVTPIIRHRSTVSSMEKLLTSLCGFLYEVEVP